MIDGTSAAGAPAEADRSPRSPAGPGDARPPDARPPDARRRHPLEILGLLSLVLFAVLSIGSPLWGGSVLAATDELSTVSPYEDAGMAGMPVRNELMDDTLDAVIPDTVLFRDQLRDGHVAAWNPYIMGGVPLGSVPTLALLSPLTVPYYLLPAALAPGYVKLAEILFAAWATWAFLRRLGLGRPAAILGGIAFAGSGFMVVWTNWPHTRTAAFVPALFWALERLIQRRRARDAALVALAVAGLLAGGFPAVTAFALYTAGPYLVVRVLASHRGQWRRVAGVLAAAGAALAAGFALMAVQLLPFARFLSLALVQGRTQDASNHVDPGSLVTMLAPFALGSVDPSRQPLWNLPGNLVESTLYLGAAALVLLVVAVATPAAARRFLPPGVWPFLVGATAAWILAIYTRPGAVAVHQLPVFASNFVGRGRGVLGLLLAALAAIGLEVLLRGRPEPARRWGWRGPAVWAGFAVAGVAVLVLAVDALRRAGGTGDDLDFRLANLARQTLLGGALLAAAGLAAALLWWGPGWRRGSRPGVRTAAAAALTVLAALQSGIFAWQYLPHAPRSTFYPATATHRYLAAHLGHDRFTPTGLTMFRGATSSLALRSFSGHSYLDRSWSELAEGLPGPQFDWPTYVDVPPTAPVATSPVLDRTGVRYLVTSPRDAVFGERHSPATVTGSTVLTAAGSTVPLATSGPLRAVTLTPTGPLPRLDPRAAIEVTLVDPAGRTVGTSRRLLVDGTPGDPVDVPLVEGSADARLTARLRLVNGPPAGLPVAAGPDGRPATGTVSADHPDGLRLVQAGPAVIWQRLNALPRIRWAARASVVPDRDQVDLLAGGRVPADTVLLGAPGGPADGRPAAVTPTRDGSDEIDVSVRAAGAGYLVIADAIRSQWVATLDGRPVPLVAADHGLAAVAVPSGQHDVRVRYRSPYAGAGGVVSLLTLVALVGLLVLRRAEPRRPRAGGAGEQPRTGGAGEQPRAGGAGEPDGAASPDQHRTPARPADRAG